ncbi:MAG: hypothetical protein EP330_01190 [Deltaproteobacteria bacterium]|nr:MAG: hypothetical protein EP330_01190 [Deltaproteobacteria bacterium]
MLDHVEAKSRLTALGVARWDTSPPTDGVIRWFDASGAAVATGKYRVILSVGPGAKYTMAHAIGAYASIGIPFVEAVADEPTVVEGITDEADIWARAERVAEAVGAEFVYQCSTLLVAVTESGISG